MAFSERGCSLAWPEPEEICSASVRRQRTIRAAPAFLESFLTASRVSLWKHSQGSRDILTRPPGALLPLSRRQRGHGCLRVCARRPRSGPHSRRAGPIRERKHRLSEITDRQWNDLAVGRRPPFFLCNGRGIAVAVLSHVLNDVGNSLENVLKPEVIEPALFGVGLRQSERSYQFN